MIYIATATSLNTKNISLPEILLIHPDYISDYYNKLNGTKEVEVAAFYDNKKFIIVLKSDFDIASIADQATLAHEMVHHYQILNNVPRDCNAQLERQAYKLSNRWLKEHGGEVVADDFTIFIRSICADY